MSENFYFRIRGEVKGPYTREQIVALIRKKRLGRHHELSADAVNWQRAGSIEGLFEPSVIEDRPAHEEPAEQSRPRGASPADTFSNTPAPAASSPNTMASGNSDEWFYAKGRNTHGPVSSKDLRAMLATGRVLGTDRIWNESLSDWVPAQDVPQFMGSIVSNGDPYKSPTSDRQYVPAPGFLDVFLGLSSDTTLPSTSSRKFPNLCRYLAIAEGVARILFILELLAATGWFGFVMFVSFRTSEGLVIAGTFFACAIGLVMTFAVLWFVFLATLAFLEMPKVLIRIEDNTSG